MADTTLAIRNNRFLDDAFLFGTVASVPLDAITFETFFLPTGFGQCIIKAAFVAVGSLSGSYVAPAPAYDGPELYVLSSDLSTRIDSIGSRQWVHTGTLSTRPQLSTSHDLNNFVLLRQNDRLAVQIPISAGAGVTGSVTVSIRGRRIQTA